ncbi:efflux RND transporter periplasmic adaptor subunit [Phormidesmis priestleyi]
MVQKKVEQFVEPMTPFTQPRRSWFLNLVVAVVLAAGAGYGYTLIQKRSITQAQAPVVKASPKPATRAVAALGRLQPKGEITRLSAFNSLEGARIDQLFVREGDSVRVGQVVATLTTRLSREAALVKAQKQVQIVQAQLERVKAGAKTDDITAQKAAIERLQAEANNAQLEYQRNQSLFAEGAISASQQDSKRLAVETLRAQLNQAKATLGSVAEVRPVDINVAEAEVANAIAAVRAAETDLELTNLRSPIYGQVLKVHTRVGEIVGTDGIAEIANTDTMYAVTEVYETDIKKVRIGQKAAITSDAISEKLQGTVAEVGLQVGSQNTFSINPLAKTDRRVIEVKVELTPEDSQRVSGLTNLQVQVIFKQ